MAGELRKLGKYSGNAKVAEIHLYFSPLHGTNNRSVFRGFVSNLNDYCFVGTFGVTNLWVIKITPLLCVYIFICLKYLLIFSVVNRKESSIFSGSFVSGRTDTGKRFSLSKIVVRHHGHHDSQLRASDTQGAPSATTGGDVPRLMAGRWRNEVEEVPDGDVFRRGSASIVTFG